MKSPSHDVDSKIKRARLIPRDKHDGFAIKRTGYQEVRFADLYLSLLEMPWRHLIGLIALIYFSINLAFACVYLLIDHGIENALSGSFTDAFFFSVQTFSTIGYGRMAPLGLTANLAVTAEVLIGFIFFAVTTGLLFSKFSRPTARVLFSNVAVICPYEGKPHLMIRLANQRNNRIVDANVHVVMLRKETTKEGHSMRRFYDLPTVRARIPILQLTWTLMHPIDEQSPLYGATEDTLREWDAEILVSLMGLDETFSQTIHTRWSYIVDDIHCDAMFEDVIQRQEADNGIIIDYTKFHTTHPIKA